jgi:hypothetical protein
MILLKPSLVDLAPAYEQISEFNRSLQSKWIPGFNQSYTRKQAAYLKAAESYEGRSRFMRLIFKSPKPPGKPPPDLYEEMSGRLWQDWITTISCPLKNVKAKTKEGQDLLSTLAAILDERYFVLPGLKTRYEEFRATVTVGPTDGWIVRLVNKEPAQLGSSSSAQIEYIPLPISWPIEHESPPNETAKQLALFQLIDELLSYHQRFAREETISALKAAEKLISQEKDRLLKLAATL